MGRQLKQPKIRSVKFNVVMNTILTTSTFLFPLITVPYVSRVLGPDNNGIVSWAFTFVGYFSLVALLGFNMYGTRECAKLRDDREKLSVVVQELLVPQLLCTSHSLYWCFCCPAPMTNFPSCSLWAPRYGFPHAARNGSIDPSNNTSTSQYEIFSSK